MSFTVYNSYCVFNKAVLMPSAAAASRGTQNAMTCMFVEARVILGSPFTLDKP